MGILPVGFFSPLPLAMMIPFMATQSLAMGEAFGKSFQYGKRKISSMSNEEFNKLTFHDLMVEQTANIKSIIPELNKQMAVSQDMQKAIFQEMIKLIPTFFESFKKAIPSDLTETSLASPPSAITSIRYAGRTEPQEETQARLDAALKLFNDNFLKQQGTKESYAEKLAQQNPPPGPTPYTTPEELRIPSAKTLQTAQDTEWIAFAKEAGLRKANIATMKAQIAFDIRKGAKEATFRQKDYINLQRRVLVRLSNRYRDPNNNIRENALRLRRELASGQYKI